VGCDGSPCNQASGLGSCTLNQDNTQYYCSCSNPNVGVDCDLDCPRGVNNQVCSGLGVCTADSNYTLCSCTLPYVGGPACDQVGAAYGAMLESLLYTSTLYTVYSNDTVTFTPVGSNTIEIYNPLPCEDENNPYCAPFTANAAVGTTATGANVMPFFDSVANNQANSRANYMNMCINGVMGSTQASISQYANSQTFWTPLQYLQWQVSISQADFVQCFDLPYTSNPSNRFTIPAKFTEHNSIPSYLRNTTFYTRCVDIPKNLYAKAGGPNLVTTNPCQYYDCTDMTPLPENKLFSLLQTEKTLWEVCAERLPVSQTTPI
jgi:hypothetical protein